MVKRAVKAGKNLTKAASAWKAFTEAFGPLSMEFSKANFDSVTARLNGLFAEDNISIDDPLVVFLMDWIAEYEQRFVHLEDASPSEVLQHLMSANNLKQRDLATELGGQSVVSAILRGQRGINVGQAQRLAQRFGVSASVFIESNPKAEPGGAPEALVPYKVMGSNLRRPIVVHNEAAKALAYVH